MTTKGGIQGLPSDFLITQATLFGKAMSEDAFEAIFVLLIYGLVLFPNIDNFVDVNAIRIFSSLNPIPTLLGDTYFSLHMRNAKGGGSIVCCLPLLYKWFISHLPQTLAFKENKGCLWWSARLMSLTNDDISWYNCVYDGVQVIDSCGEFSNVPLLGTCGGIKYNPVLARRQLRFPSKDKPNNVLLEGLFFQEGKDPQDLKVMMVHAWRRVYRKERNELGPKNCIALEPYTAWVKKRALEYYMPYVYPRPIPMVMVGPLTLPNQGVEELRDKDRSRAWVREREELLQQLKDKDAVIEFLEHLVIDEPDNVVTSLLPHSSSQASPPPATPLARTVISKIATSIVPAATTHFAPPIPAGFPWGMPANFILKGFAHTLASLPASSPVLSVPPPVVHTLPRVEDTIYHSEPSEGPDVYEKMDEMKDQFLELRKELKTLRGKDLFGKSAAELCLVPNVKIHVKFKVPNFEKYKGNTCPLSHLVMYARKMSTQTDNDQLLIHYFQDSLTGVALRWYMGLESASIRSFNDLGKAFVKQYKYNVDMAPDRD
ncbi:hypothetical protein KIW84_061607 [Lathyrus oleraceus]|uniref:DUF7745 domain-containing protein n=1 Tax=Pisum sativum TaxID=3888 RepID=A0A9D5A759_PEA|nr:hypothetical protein KIW84_061607 [Pisum sativum]